MKESDGVAVPDTAAPRESAGRAGESGWRWAADNRGRFCTGSELWPVSGRFSFPSSKLLPAGKKEWVFQCLFFSILVKTPTLVGTETETGIGATRITAAGFLGLLRLRVVFRQMGGNAFGLGYTNAER